MLALAAPVRRAAHARRITIDPDVTLAAVRSVAASDTWYLREVLADTRSDPTIVRGLSGVPPRVTEALVSGDWSVLAPTGEVIEAAGVAAWLAVVNLELTVRRSGSPALIVDHLVLHRGLAATALTAALTDVVSLSHGGPGGSGRFVTWHPRGSSAFGAPTHETFPEHLDEVLARVRHHLALASDDVYDEAVETLEALRETVPRARPATSYLVPDRRDWVSADLSAVDPEAWYQLQLDVYRLLGAATTVAQTFAVIRFGTQWLHLHHPAAVTTMAVALGPDALASLWWLLEHEPDRVRAPERRRLLRLVGAIPTDVAFESLAVNLEQPHVAEVVGRAARRYPRRAARILGSIAGGDDGPAEIARELLRKHLDEHPDLASGA